MPPSMAKPTMKLRTPATVKTLPRNRRMGSTGSAARSSTKTKAAKAITEPTAIHRMVGEIHGYSVPPQLVTRVRPVAARAMRRMPA